MKTPSASHSSKSSKYSFCYNIYGNWEGAEGGAMAQAGLPMGKQRLQAQDNLTGMQASVLPEPREEKCKEFFRVQWGNGAF